MTSTATNLTLLERARQRDNTAWCELVDLYGPLLIRWCHRLGADQEATADCIQEVFAAVSRSLDSYHPRGTRGAFRGWLWTITRNKLRDAARRNRGMLPAAGGSSAMMQWQAMAESVDAINDDPSLISDEADLMSRALGQIESSFAPQTWQAFWRSAIDGLTTDVVADQLGLSHAAVRQSRSRVMRRLRQQLLDL